MCSHNHPLVLTHEAVSKNNLCNMTHKDIDMLKILIYIHSLCHCLVVPCDLWLNLIDFEFLFLYLHSNNYLEMFPNFISCSTPSV